MLDRIFAQSLALNADDQIALFERVVREFLIGAFRPSKCEVEWVDAADFTNRNTSNFDEYHVIAGLSDDLRSNRCHARVFIEGDDIHIVTASVGWQEHVGEHHTGGVEGVYYIRYNIADQTFYRTNGEAQFKLSESPVYGAEYFDEIWDFKKDANGDHRGLWADIVAKNGRPFIAYAVQEGVPRG